jgi:hypothetical protein
MQFWSPAINGPSGVGSIGATLPFPRRDGCRTIGELSAKLQWVVAVLMAALDFAVCQIETVHLRIIEAPDE